MIELDREKDLNEDFFCNNPKDAKSVFYGSEYEIARIKNRSDRFNGNFYSVELVKGGEIIGFISISYEKLKESVSNKLAKKIKTHFDVLNS